MVAAWDWHHPRTGPDDDKRLASLLSEVGFDTVVIHTPTASLLRECRRRGVRVVAVVSPTADEVFIREQPDAVQRMLEAEERAADALRGLPADYNAEAGRWYPIFQPSPLVCYRHAVSMDVLRDRVREALSDAEGVALDGFGFRNHHRCYCAQCREVGEDPVAYNRESLVLCSEELYAYAKSVNPNAIVMNHVWPPFRPDPRYSRDLRLDYCSETISWFYPPTRTIQQVEAEARSLAAHSRRNAFVPFIGLFRQDRCRRSIARIVEEIRVARSAVPGHLVFSTLQGLIESTDMRKAIAQELGHYPRS